MSLVIIQNHPFEIEIREIMMQFFPKEEIIFLDSVKNMKDHSSYIVRNGYTFINNDFSFYTIVETKGTEISNIEMHFNNRYFKNANEKIKWIKRKLKTIIYKTFEKVLKHSLPWGILTGVRPTKIVHQSLKEGKNTNEAKEYLKSEYLINTNKASLLLEVALNEENIISNKKNISLYIGIPFCPSRCSYCSFVSYIVKKDRRELKKYLKALYYEITKIGEYIKSKSIEVESIYIGGGTPTVLTEKELEELLWVIKRAINIDKLAEYTLEAGRPDTINKKKLQVAFENKISRISINPQTMNIETLHNIGRQHSPKEVVESYCLARKVGFTNINMDMIVGLPGEGAHHIQKTLQEIIKLSPENITLHTMFIKKGSLLKQEYNNSFLQTEKIKNTLHECHQRLHDNGYIPYYLYRQKYMVDNMENTGYCKPGNKGIYNIEIMSDKHTIIGLGAGSSSKYVLPNKRQLKKTVNTKDIKQYINGIQEITNKKTSNLNEIYNSSLS